MTTKKSMTSHTTPKLLPWLAKKAGISERLAEALWQEAASYAARHAELDSPRYFNLAVDRLLEYVETESLREDAASFGVRPWIRSQNRFWAASLGLVETGSLLTRRSIGMLQEARQKGTFKLPFGTPWWRAGSSAH